MSPNPIDKRLARRAFEQAAGDYDRVAVLQQEIARRMLDRLEYIKLTPQVVADVGAGTGYSATLLQRRYPEAQVLALDFALAMLARARLRGAGGTPLHCIGADAESLPLADASLDLLFSSALLQWCNDLGGTLQGFLRVLRPGGLLLFTTFGPDTLMELRAAWASVDPYSHVSTFLDLHDIGDLLLQSGFADPVMDVERITLTYETVPDLMRDLKTLGAHNVTNARPRGLTSPRRLRAMVAAYEGLRRDGRLPASYEVVHGHAWAPRQRATADGVGIPLSFLRGRLR